MFLYKHEIDVEWNRRQIRRKMKNLMGKKFRVILIPILLLIFSKQTHPKIYNVASNIHILLLIIYFEF